MKPSLDGTNCTERKPAYKGEKVTFPSPHHSDVMLVDIAERNRYGHLVWVAYHD